MMDHIKGQRGFYGANMVTRIWRYSLIYIEKIFQKLAFSEPST
jgi:hypothetical protein